MLTSEDRKVPVKMAGYLEKKSKMKVVCRWKKMWFVLEGRLLLYYKSQLEYLSLSPCRGTVNLGLAANVVPGKSYEIIVSTRSHTVSLRALNKSDHDIWLQALIDAMYAPNSSYTLCCSKPVHHFRYSTGGLDKHHKTADTNHSHTLAARLSPMYPPKCCRTSPLPISRCDTSESLIKDLPESESHEETLNEKNSGAPLELTPKEPETKLVQLSKRFNKIAASDTSIHGKFKKTPSEISQSNSLRRSISVEHDFHKYAENIYETVRDVSKTTPNGVLGHRPSRRVKRSDSECIPQTRATLNRQRRGLASRSEQQISEACEQSPLLVNHRKWSDGHYEINNETLRDLTKRYTSKLNGKSRPFDLMKSRLIHKEVKSDTDLSMVKKKFIKDTGSLGAIYGCEIVKKESKTLYDMRTKHSHMEVYDFYSNGEAFGKGPPRINRNNSFLRRFSKDERQGERFISMTKRSMSFLKKIWKKKEKKTEEDPLDDTFFHDPPVLIEVPSAGSEFEESGNYTRLDLHFDYDVPQPEPPPDYDQVNSDDEEPPALPPRRTVDRSVSPWHDSPSNNQLVEEPEPPALPEKQNKPKGPDFVLHESTSENDVSGLKQLFKESPTLESGRSHDRELGEMLVQLTEMTETPLRIENGHKNSETNSEDEDSEPDYDVPRPHAALIASLTKKRASTNAYPPSNYFSNYDDSLDVSTREKFDELTMAPDSLECDPWSLSNESENPSETWIRYPIENRLPHNGMTTLGHPESLFQDSLNTTSPKLEYNHYLNGFIQLHS